jgi:hypothetical protein
VRRVAIDGSVYYDAIIYFGSPFGPVTYSFCTTKMASIMNSGGSAISAADCLGTAGSAVATINGTQIHLPQYLARPTGVSPYWALSVYSAGDVNRDGNNDLLVMDYYFASMYLFFGSSSGIVDGTPRMGPSISLEPQFLVLRTNTICGQVLLSFPPKLSISQRRFQWRRISGSCSQHIYCGSRAR